MHEKRDIERTRVMRSAKIIIGPDARMVDCTILNLTNRGASVDIADSFAMPDLFQITLDNGRTVRSCRLIWRRNERLGVAFQHQS